MSLLSQPVSNNSYPIKSQPSPFDPCCRPFPTTRISPAKSMGSIVCIRPELFCRPFPTVNSLQTDALYPDLIRTPFRYPFVPSLREVYCCEAFRWISKRPSKASISPFIATPRAIPYSDVMLTQWRTFSRRCDSSTNLCGID